MILFVTSMNSLNRKYNLILDFHGNWDRQTGHVAPLYFVPGDKWDYFNANFTSNQALT